MAERDPRRLGGASEVSKDAPAATSPRPPASGGGDDAPLDLWGQNAPPQPARGQPGLSWSNLADLDEGEPLPSDPGHGVGPVEGTGGLLGVDSGLLRVIESDDPSGRVSGAFPSDVLDRPTVRPPDPVPPKAAPEPRRPAPEPARPAPRFPAQAKAGAKVAPEAAAEHGGETGESAQWVTNVFGNIEVEPEESGAWLDSIVSQAAVDVANTSWGAVDGGGPEGAPLVEPLEAPSVVTQARSAEPAKPPAVVTPPQRPRPARDEWHTDDVEDFEPVPDALGGNLVDAWGEVVDDGESSWGAPSAPSRRSVVPMAPPDPLRELDPFAAPVGGGLQDELGALGGDPFDSLSMGDAPPFLLPEPGAESPPPPRRHTQNIAGPRRAMTGEFDRFEAPAQAPVPAEPPTPPPVEAEAFPVDMAGLEDLLRGDEPEDAGDDLAAWVRGDDAPTVSPEPPPPPAPIGIDPEALAAARALLAERSAARLAEAFGGLDAFEHVSLEEVLSDGADRRVVRIEHASAAELEIERDNAPGSGLFDLSAGAAPESGVRKSILARLSEEPLDVDEPRDRGARPHAHEDSGDAFVFDILSSSAAGHPAAAASEAPDPWAPPEDDETAIAPERPEGPLDRLALDRLGAPLLGVVQNFEPAPRQSTFPPGSLGLQEPMQALGPAVVPELPLPEPFDLDAPGHRLLAMLHGEIFACDDRRRLSHLLHAFGRVAVELLGDADLARPAFRGAQANDPTFALNRWAVLEDLDDHGDVEELVAALARTASAATPDFDALYRAGHVVAARLNDPSRALGLWQRAIDSGSQSAGPLLARYSMLLSQLDWEGADAALAALSEQVEGPVLLTLLQLDRLRLADELGLPDSVQQACVRLAQEKSPGAPVVQAALERYVATFGDLELLLAGLRGRFDAVSADFQRGRLSEYAAKREVGEIFYKAAWALERLGRRTDALREYQNALQSLPNDPYLLHRAGELARRLGRGDEHRGHLERVAALARDTAEAANALYQMGLIAQNVLADETLAARDFERAVAAMPTFTPALAALGRQALRQGRWGDVRQRFETEIDQLEEALDRDQAVEVRERTIRGLLTRYYRVARVLEQNLTDDETALAYHKRALALSPRFLPPFLAIERTYESAGRWRELVALYLGLVERAGDGELDVAGLLSRAADILHTRQGDDRNAARACARILANHPDDLRVLERAAEIFSRLGNRAALVEVELRRAALAVNGRQKARHLLRAAEMQCLDGDPLAAAAEATPMFRGAWDAEPGLPGAFEGVLRCAALLGRSTEVGHLVARLPDLAPLDPVLLAQATDALLAAGRPDDALVALDIWRRVARNPDSVLPLRVVALERAQAWRPLTDALEEMVGRMPDARRRAGLLARIGEIHEFRLGEPELAAETYHRALVLDADCAVASDGVMRVEISGHDSMLSAGTRSAISGLMAARNAALAGNILDMAGHVERLAQTSHDERTASAVHRISQGSAADDDVMRRAFEDAPMRLDHFEAWMARLLGTERRPERIAALWMRLPHEEGSDRSALLASLLAHCEQADDSDGVTRAAEALLEMDPASLVAALALRRQAQRAGREVEAFEAGERLAGLLQSPMLAARTYRKLADEAARLEMGPARVRALLEQAVVLDPSNRAATSALEARLREEQDWDELLALYNRRIVAGLAREEARELYLAKARLLGEPLEQPDEAVATLRSFVEQFSDDAAGVLAAGHAARTFGAQDMALAWLDLAAASEDPAVAAEAAVSRARLLRDFGDLLGARRELERLLARVTDCVPALELLAELLGLQRDWPGVVRTMRRLFELRTEPKRRAETAIGIAEILSRVRGDARAAAGWFKRAIELDSGALHAVWRMLEEADRLPPGEVPVQHLLDAVDRALSDVQLRLAEDPFNVESLRGFAQLQIRRQGWDAAYLARSALEYINEADAAERAFLSQRRSRLVVDFAQSLTPGQRAQYLLADGERSAAADVFELFALVLTDLLSERPPSGATRLSARSFSRWQNDFAQIAHGLGAEDVELWQIGQAPARLAGTYLPSPALIVGADVLAAPVDAVMAFRLGHLIDGLQRGRMLFDRVGSERVASVVRLMLEAVAPEAAPRVTGASALPNDLRTRIVDRAQRLPRRLLASLDSRLQEGPETALDFHLMASAVAQTRARAGFLAAGDVGVALESVRTMAAGQYDTRNIRTLAPAQQLLSFILSPACGHLRVALGVAVQR